MLEDRVDLGCRWRLDGLGVAPGWAPNPMCLTDDAALEGYLDLLDGGYGFTAPMFTERHWAFLRFERSLSAEEAFVRVRKVRSADRPQKVTAHESG